MIREEDFLRVERGLSESVGGHPDQQTRSLRFPNTTRRLVSEIATMHVHEVGLEQAHRPGGDLEKEFPIERVATQASWTSRRCRSRRSSSSWYSGLEQSSRHTVRMKEIREMGMRARDGNAQRHMQELTRPCAPARSRSGPDRPGLIHPLVNVTVR